MKDVFRKTFFKEVLSHMKYCFKASILLNISIIQKKIYIKKN